MISTRKAACALAGLTLFAVTSTAYAVPLTGGGPNLGLPTGGDPPRQGRALSGVTSAGFNGTWTAPALSPWIGTFSAQGPVPAGTASPAGIARYEFSGLNAGLLPAGTIFGFGDVDSGSTTSETFILQAFDGAGGLISTPWLDEPIGVSGSGTGGGGSILPGNMPGWNWNPTLGEYTIDGSTVTGGNPTLNVFLESNMDISFLSVERTSTFANFSLSAPIPEPATAGLLALGGLVMLRRRS